jgi:hypothetical protein
MSRGNQTQSRVMTRQENQARTMAAENFVIVAVRSGSFRLYCTADSINVLTKRSVSSIEGYHEHTVVRAPRCGCIWSVDLSAGNMITDSRHRGVLSRSQGKH